MGDQVYYDYFTSDRAKKGCMSMDYIKLDKPPVLKCSNSEQEDDRAKLSKLPVLKKDILKSWIRENIVINVELCSEYSPDNSVIIGLRFKDEDKPFTSCYISIPEDSVE